MIDLQVTDWLELKRSIEAFTDLDRDALHIYAAVAVQTATALVTRRKLGDWLPWLVVAVLTLGNEAADVYSDIWPDQALQAGKSIHDFVNTMIMPTFLLVVSRLRPALLRR